MLGIRAQAAAGAAVNETGEWSWGRKVVAPQKDGFPTDSPARCWDVGRFLRAVSMYCLGSRAIHLKKRGWLPKKTAFQLILQRVVGMWVDFFVLAPNQNSGWALVNSSIGLSVSAGNACAHFFANRRTRSIPRRPSSVRVTGQTSQMRVSETGRKRARVKAAVASAAVVNTTMIRAAHAAESPKAQGSPRSACSKTAPLQLPVWKRLSRTSLRRSE